jgi:hypothetical protein
VTGRLAARPEDVASTEAIVTALYDVISGDAGAPRDWERFRALLHPGARMMPARGGTVQVLDADGYIARVSPALAAHGFHEVETKHRVDRHGVIAQVWSTYESRHSLSDPEPFARGINSIQLFHDGARWWVLSVAWTSTVTPEMLSLTKA